MEERGQPFASAPVKSPGKKRTGMLVGIGVAGMLVMFGGGLLLAVLFASPAVHVPKAIRSQVSFPIHAPTKLPKGYQIAADSYSYAENVLIYKATSGSFSLNFTEQAKPAGFNFQDFYKEQLTNSQPLGDAPNESVWGKSQDGKNTILSVVTDKTWLIMSTPNTLDENQILKIAQGIKLAN